MQVYNPLIDARLTLGKVLYGNVPKKTIGNSTRPQYIEREANKSTKPGRLVMMTSTSHITIQVTTGNNDPSCMCRSV